MNRILLICLIILSNMLYLLTEIHAQEAGYVPVTIEGKKALIVADSALIFKNDTTIYLLEGTPYVIKDLSEYRSGKFYQLLEEKAEKNGISSKLYDLLIVKDVEEKEEDYGFSDIDDIYEEFQGREIVKIRIKHVPLYSGNVNDTAQHKKSGLSGFLNNTHVNTRESLIRSGLQFKEGEQLQSVQIAESERLIRAERYIQDVQIYVKERAGGKVEVVVVVQDRYSLGVELDYNSLEKWGVYGVENNFLGSATSLKLGLLYDAYYQNAWGSDIQIRNSNINGKFLQGELEVLESPEQGLVKVGLFKNFITPEARYAGGFEYRYSRDLRDQLVEDSIWLMPYKGYFIDGWFGRSFLLGELEDRKNLIISGRLVKRFFNEVPEQFEPGLYPYFNNSDILLGSVILRSIKYYSTKNLLSFGITENLPYGFYTNFTLGYEESDYVSRPYLGNDFVLAKDVGGLGYFSGSFRWGGFLNTEGLSDARFDFNVNYFANIVNIKNTRWRNLFWLSYSWLRQGELNGYLTLERYIRDLFAPTWAGQSRAVVKWESVFFLPANFYGFRFAVYGFADLGWLSPAQNAFQSGRLVSEVGLGVRMRNESLSFNTISLHIGYLSDVPRNGNPFKTYFSSSPRNTLDIPFNERPEMLLPRY